MTNKNKNFYLLGTALVLLGGLMSQNVQAETIRSMDDRGIQIQENSATKSLNIVGKLDADTGVYSDTQGLTPQVDMDKVRTFNHIKQEVPAVEMKQPLANAQVSVSPAQMAKATPDIQSRQSVAVDPVVQGFMEFDDNNNQLISEEEFFLHDLSVYSRQTFNRFDTNNDRWMNLDEFEAYFLRVDQQS